MSALLAIDYGTKRCGLARSDPNRVLSTGLPTFERRPGRSFHDHLRSLTSDGDYDLVVIGFPRHERETGWSPLEVSTAVGGGVDPRAKDAEVAREPGRAARLAEEILSLGGWIERELGLPVVYWDESLTSQEAERRLRMARRAQRRDRAAIDRLAAEILLQEFLDAGCPMPAGPSKDDPPKGSGASEGDPEP